MKLCIGSALVFVGVLQAQSVQPPTLGYIYDAARMSVRRVSGIMNSARAEESYGPSLKRAVISSSGGYALGWSTEGGLLRRVDLPSGKSTTLDGAAESSKAVISPLGSSVALVSLDGKQVEIWTEFAETPRLDNTQALGADEKVVALSDGGDVLLTTDGVVLSAYEAGSRKQLFRPRELGAVAFLPNSRTVVFSDQADEKVYLLRDLLQPSVLANISKPGALSGTMDSLRVLVVSGSKLAAIQIADGLIEDVDCSCEPTRLDLLGGESLFQLTDGDAGPIWLVDGRSLRTAFVPKPELSNE